jgi:hypothetical protein
VLIADYAFGDQVSTDSNGRSDQMRNMLVATMWLSATALLIGQQSGAPGHGREFAAALQQTSVHSPGSMLPSMGSKFAGAQETQGTPAGAPVSLPQTLGPKAPGKIRIGIAVAQAQMGQGNNAQSNYGVPARNAIIFTMSGPAVEIAALDASLPIQVQAEAQQKECDYILLSAVTVKRSGGGLGKFMKAGSIAANVTSIGIMTHTIPSTNGAIAVEETSYAIEHATSQLFGFNGQIKSKDEVTFTYQLLPTGQSKPKFENSLKGKTRSDGEDVLSPLIQQAANGILTDVTRK